MLDKFTNLNVTKYFASFATFVEDGFPMNVFLGLFEISNDRKDAHGLFEKLFLVIKERGLD